MKITELLNLKWGYQMTEELFSLLFDNSRRIKAFERYLATEPDLSQDCFLAEFQEKFADRGGLKQDYTPASICHLTSAITGKADSVLDVCCGTGALTLAKWADCPNAQFYCEEFSKEAVAILLFNLAVRGINAEVRHGNVLTGETFSGYKLTRNGKFSDIEIIDLDWQGLKVDCVISNPPYSLGWEPKSDERFAAYPLAPKSKADYAFILHGLHYLKDSGTASFILPQGVLFRGAKEGDIRQKLLEESRLDSVIGLPEKLFLATQIPVQIMTFKQNVKDVYICDASHLFEKGKATNLMNNEHLEAILNAYQSRKDVEKLAKVVSFDEIKNNNFNLNLPRYVDKTEAPDVPDLLQVARELLILTKETDEAGRKFIEMMGTIEVCNGNTQAKSEFEEAKRVLQQVFAPRHYEVGFIEKISTVNYLPLFTNEEITQIEGFIEHKQKQIEQLQLVKKYFLHMMFVQ